MQLTSEQQAIVETEISSDQVLKVIALAGTGKTTTLYEYAKARPRQKFLYVAFNKSVQNEAYRKFPTNVISKTAHSLAYRYFGTKYRHKLSNFLKANTISDALDISSYENAKFVMDTLNNYLSSEDENISSRHVPISAHQYYDQQKKKDSPNFVRLAGILWKHMIDPDDDRISMIHNGYLKLYQLSKPMLNFGCILLDEAQDINPVIKNIILSQSCSKILVGDPHQQIYSWRGAENIMDQIHASQTLYLTRSFRFGDQIASVANIILQELKSEKTAIIGLNENDHIGVIKGNHTIIARTNAGVFNEAVRCYKKNSIGFIGGIEGYKLNEILDTHYLFARKKSQIRDSYIKSFKTFSEMKQFVESAEDWELKSRITIVEKYREDIPDLVSKIRDAAVDADKAKICLSTAHKSKGLEFESVRVVDDFPELVKDGEINTENIDPEEFNLLYVTVTRARKNLALSSGLEAYIDVVL